MGSEIQRLYNFSVFIRQYKIRADRSHVYTERIYHRSYFPAPFTFGILQPSHFHFSADPVIAGHPVAVFLSPHLPYRITVFGPLSVLWLSAAYR